MWVYSEEYIDESDGVSTAPMIPRHAALVGTTSPTGFSYYSSIIQLDQAGYEQSFQLKLVPRLLYDLKGETAEFRLQSRPVLIPLDCASWTVTNCVPPPAASTRKKVAIPTEASEPNNKLSKKGS
jgi:hypothetical protein